MRQTQGGGMTVDFTAVEGTQHWQFGTNGKIIVDILNQKPKDSGFQTWEDPDGNQFQSRIFTDEQGNLHVWIVPGKSVDQYTKERLLEMYLFGPASIIANRNQQVQKYSSELASLDLAPLNLRLSR